MAKTWTAPELLALSNAHWPSCVLQAAVELDVFTVLETLGESGAPVSAQRLADALGCDGRGFSMLVSALLSLEFLQGGHESLSLPEGAAACLSRRSEGYVGFIISHHTYLMPAWARLAEAVRTGTRVRENSSSDARSEAEREAFLMGMFNVAMNQGKTVAKALNLAGRNRLLDLGGGPGTYAVFFCRENPGLRATIFDLPSTEKTARGIVKRFGLEERIDFAGGDFFESELPGGYDVVWMSQVLHGESPENAAKLVARAARCLNPGGMLAIQDFVLDDDRAGPRHPALFSLNMLVGTAGGQSYSWSEITAMLLGAGAESVRRVDADLPMNCGILTGILPERRP